MSDIFLSYVHEDLVRAKQLAKALEARGWSVFWDQKIPPGKTWYDVIEKALQRARCVVVIWSKISIDKNWVREEAEEGNTRKILVPVLFDNVVPPRGFRSIQAANLIDWNGNQNTVQYQQLINAITDILGSPKQSTISQPHSQKPQKTLWIVGLSAILATITFLSLQINTPESLQLTPPNTAESIELSSIEKQKSTKDHKLIDISNRKASTPQLYDNIVGTYLWTKGQTMNLDGTPLMPTHPEYEGKLVIETLGKDAYLITGAVTLKGLGTKSRGPYRINHIEHKQDGSLTAKKDDNFEIKLHGTVLTMYDRGKNYVRSYEWRKVATKEIKDNKYLDRYIQRERELYKDYQKM